MHILSNLIFIPIIGALILMGVGRGRDGFCRGFALVVSGVVFVMSIPLYTGFVENTPEMQFSERIPWITSIGANYAVGLSDETNERPSDFGPVRFAIWMNELFSFHLRLISSDFAPETVGENSRFIFLLKMMPEFVPFALKR